MRRELLTIVISLRLDYWSGRDILAGILRHARQRYPWRINIMAAGADLQELRHPERFGIGGMIMDSVLNEDVLPLLRDSPVPLVLIGDPTPAIGARRRSLAFVKQDDAVIGRQCAEFLLSLGRHGSYGFVPSRNAQYCSNARLDGFRQAIGRSGRPCHIFQAEADVTAGSRDDTESIARWLGRLPRPAAVMAVHDLRATSVSAAAALAGLRIPTDLALIGVDNDELLCDFNEPPLTSFAPDHVHEGELAARALNALISDPGRESPRVVVCRSGRIIERLSAKSAAPGEMLVSRARSFIRDDALKGIGPKDVAAFLGVSRRLLDQRFRQFTGKSILATIQERRLAEIRRRVMTSRIPFGKIVVACGYRDVNHVKRLFKARYGCTMTDCRSRATSPADAPRADIGGRTPRVPPAPDAGGRRGELTDPSC